MHPRPKDVLTKSNFVDAQLVGPPLNGRGDVPLQLIGTHSRRQPEEHPNNEPVDEVQTCLTRP